MEVLPSLLGLLLAVYVTHRIYLRRAQFFKVARGLVLVLSVAALAVLWSSELAASSLSGGFEDANLFVGVSFVIFVAWLSTVLVSLFTLYPKLNSTDDLLALLRERPFSFIAVWGYVGLAILVLWMLGSAYQSRPLSETDWILVPAGVYLLSSIAFDLGMPVIATKRGKLRPLTPEGRVSMVLMATAWTGMPMAEFALDLVPDMALGFEESNPYAWLMVILFAVVARSISSAGFLGLVVSPEAETLERDGFRSFDIPRGVYLICDSRPDTAFSLFSELCTLPLRPDAKLPSDEASAKATLEFLIPNGLVVTREFPDKVRQIHNLQVTPIIWLTESPGDRRVAPTSLTVLTDTVTRFMEANPNSIVLLEGVEYLVTHNGFKKVLKQLDALNETTWLARARLLLTIDAKAFEEKDLALLERDRIVVRGAEDIEELKGESIVAAAFD